MMKPSQDEIQRALESANTMLDSGNDEAGLARCLNYFHQRSLQLEGVFLAVEGYMHSGMAEREHALLLKALEQARDAERRWTHADDEDTLGL